MSTWRNRFRVHRAADLFPMMPADGIAELAEDIKTHGLKKRIIFLRDGADVILLDGRNRLAAMERAGIEIDAAKHCQINESLPDSVAYVVSANVHRRHLTKEQRAMMLAAEYFADACEVSVGGRGNADEAKAKVVAAAAEHGIGKRTVENAIAEVKARNRAAQEPHERPSDAPNAPKEHWAEAKRLEREERKREAAKERRFAASAKRDAERAKLASVPTNLNAARALYLKFVKADADLDAEMQLVIDAIHEIAGERLHKKGAGP